MLSYQRKYAGTKCKQRNGREGGIELIVLHKCLYIYMYIYIYIYKTYRNVRQIRYCSPVRPGGRVARATR